MSEYNSKHHYHDSLGSGATVDVSSSHTEEDPSSAGGSGSNKKPFAWEGPKAKTPFPPYPGEVQPVDVPYQEHFLAAEEEKLTVADTPPSPTPEETNKKPRAWVGVMKSKLDKRRERGWGGFKANVAQGWGDLKSSLGSYKTDVQGVTLNGFPLSVEQVHWFTDEFPQIVLRSETHYWYDASSGWIGKVGGKRKFVCDPQIQGIRGELHPYASCMAPGSSGSDNHHRIMSNLVSLNGRILSQEEVNEFKMLNCELQDETAYLVMPNGDMMVVQENVPLCNWRQQRKIRNRNVAIGAGVAVVAVAAGGMLMDGAAVGGGGEAMVGGGGEAAGGNTSWVSGLTDSYGGHDAASGAGYVMTDSGGVTYGM